MAEIKILQEKALAMLDSADTISPSPLWPNIRPDLFFSNVRKNVLFPAQINQGKSTNFCSYAALTHILAKYAPDKYVDYILTIYRKGEVKLYKRTIKSSERIRNAAGTFHYKGDLDILHADQLWFLTLVDNFKGYINFFDHKFDMGDENAVWAATNYSKFNEMLRAFGNFKVTAAGSDLIRPMKDNYFDYLSKQRSKGIVMLYINSKFLYPHKYTLFTLRAPTHFIVLYEIHRDGDLIQFKYWDYGLKTEQLITKKRLFKLIFGVTTISNK